MPTGTGSRVPASYTNPSFTTNDKTNKGEYSYMDQLGNVKGLNSSIIVDKNSYSVPINHKNSVESTSLNLKGNTVFNNTTYTKPLPATTKETTICSYTGGAKSNTLASYDPSSYISTNYKSGATKLTTNKNIIANYCPTGGRSNVIVGDIGEVEFSKKIDDLILIDGSGTFNRSNINGTKNNPISKNHIGETTMNYNKKPTCNYWRTENYVIEPLLKNIYSIYSSGTNLEAPQFYCSSRTRDSQESSLSSVKSPQSGKMNELPIMQSNDGYLNPMLFNSKKCVNLNTNTLCY